MKRVTIVLPIFLFIYAVGLSSCDLFNEPQPVFVLKNESSQPITKIEIWKISKEYAEADLALFKALMELMLDPNNAQKITASAVALTRLSVEEAKLLASKPTILDTVKIAPYQHRQWEFDKKGDYFIRVNSIPELERFEYQESDVIVVYNGSGLYKE